MRNSDRLRLRQPFLAASRRVRLYFDTGSAAKFAQAKLVFARVGLPIGRSGAGTAGVGEDYFGGVQQLIEEKLRRVSLGRWTVYFVEDTYIRIEALSEPTEATPLSAEWASTTFPGLETKEWFQTTTFDDLDLALEAKCGDRRASVYSTIGLYLPGISDPQVFTGCTTGSIARRPATGLAENEPYPWLHPDSFNAWFIPTGESAPLSDLDLERSMDVDFRVSALLSLLDRLEEYISVLNLPSVSLEYRPSELTIEDLQSESPEVRQPQLFVTRRPPIAVIGLTCAGKTTLGQFLAESGYAHIEASNVLRMLPGNDHAPNSHPGFLQAMVTLSSYGWDIVARLAVGYFGQYIETGVCITGLRTVEEINFLVRRFPDLVVVHLEASEETRYERYVRRDRPGDDLSLTRFRERAREHASFGLLGVADHCASIRITNSSTLDDLKALADVMARTGSAVSGSGVSRRGIGVEAASKSRIYRCAVALAAAEGSLSPADIEERQLVGDGVPIVKRNAVRKTLAEYPELARRISEHNGTSYFELTEHGYSYLSLIDVMRSVRGYSVSEGEDRDET